MCIKNGQCGFPFGFRSFFLFSRQGFLPEMRLRIAHSVRTTEIHGPFNFTSHALDMYINLSSYQTAL